MESVSITICGSPSRETIADLCDLAIKAGLGLMLQARPYGVAFEATGTVAPVKALPPAPTRKPVRAKVAAAPVASSTAPSRVPPNRQAAAARRDAVVGALRRVGDIGLSFKALLDSVKPHFREAGDSDQQVSALRNALTILQNDGKVKRVAGQWVSQV